MVVYSPPQLNLLTEVWRKNSKIKVTKGFNSILPLVFYFLFFYLMAFEEILTELTNFGSSLIPLGKFIQTEERQNFE